LPDERPLDPELEAFLQAGEPPVYFGFGSMRMPPGLAQVIVQAARQTRRRAIISAGWAGLTLTGSEPGCLGIGEVNQQKLFGQVAAVVHHGGAGTTTAAALAGAPQVIIPQAYDQRYWAQRVRHLGIGTSHAPGTPDADSLTAALEHALQPSVAARARSISLAVHTNGAQAAANLTAGPRESPRTPADARTLQLATVTTHKPIMPAATTRGSCGHVALHYLVWTGSEAEGPDAALRRWPGGRSPRQMRERGKSPEFWRELTFA
jgi:hypothetical protein